MRVEIVNDNQNWLNWGALVQIWIADANRRPTTVAELKAQMAEHNVSATVPSPDDRPVQIRSYFDDPKDPLMIMLPTRSMADDTECTPYSTVHHQQPPTLRSTVRRFEWAASYRR